MHFKQNGFFRKLGKLKQHIFKFQQTKNKPIYNMYQLHNSSFVIFVYLCTYIYIYIYMYTHLDSSIYTIVIVQFSNTIHSDDAAQFDVLIQADDSIQFDASNQLDDSIRCSASGRFVAGQRNEPSRFTASSNHSV